MLSISNVIQKPRRFILSLKKPIESNHLDTRELKKHSFNSNIPKVSTMKKKQFLAVMLLAQAPLASAATTGFDNEVDFLAQLNPTYYLEEFSGSHYGIPLSGALTENYGAVYGYSWTASVPNNWPPANGVVGLFSLTNALTTWAGEDTLTITFTGNPVTALGGIFSSTDINGAVIQQKVTVNLNDNTSVWLTGSAFRGFTSDFAILSLAIDAVDVNLTTVFWPRLEHFYVGSAIAAVPIPAAAWLFGSGLLGLLSLKRRGNIR